MRDIIIDHRYHKTIIGTQGANIRDIREKFNSVMISFPDSSRQSDVVSLRGPKNDVDQCYKHLQQIAQDMVPFSIMLCYLGFRVSEWVELNVPRSQAVDYTGTDNQIIHT